jgi:hypothetical protein
MTSICLRLKTQLQRGATAVAEVARGMGAELEAIQTAPAFRRMLLKRGAESIVIDLVREYVAQLEKDKPKINGIRVDPPQEILVPSGAVPVAELRRYLAELIARLTRAAYPKS